MYISTHTESNSKPNRMNFLFPQNGYNVRIKGIHILNAPPFSDVFISLLKRVFKSKLAARVSDFSRLLFYINKHWLLPLELQHFVLFFCFFIFFFFFSPKFTNYIDTYFSFRIQLFWLLSRADWKSHTKVSNNIKLFIYLHL